MYAFAQTPSCRQDDHGFRSMANGGNACEILHSKSAIGTVLVADAIVNMSGR